eukprot:TRINITY_DN13821_c0_g1_i3.p1 TRINITY_DN13821_c0_g1~~TRINITY_DN13821_c0_g1_i3.p1  ORF type:complete len:281 (+),score=35.01 TRINITY_DN13821_c0_g1_i3:326-1168(+)
MPLRRTKTLSKTVTASFSSQVENRLTFKSFQKARQQQDSMNEDSDCRQEAKVKKGKKRGPLLASEVMEVKSRCRMSNRGEAQTSSRGSVSRQRGEWGLNEAAKALEDRLNKILGIEPQIVDALKILIGRAYHMNEATDARVGRYDSTEIQRIQASVRDNYGSNRTVALLLNAIDRIAKAAEQKQVELELKKCRSLSPQKPKRRIATRGTYIFDQDGTRPLSSTATEAKKCFFDEAVRLKGLLPSHATTKNLLVTELYDEAIKKGLSRSEWGPFLKKKLGL